jgi:hypothetical protein
MDLTTSCSIGLSRLQLNISRGYHVVYLHADSLSPTMKFLVACNFDDRRIPQVWDLAPYLLIILEILWWDIRNVLVLADRADHRRPLVFFGCFLATASWLRRSLKPGMVESVAIWKERASRTQTTSSHASDELSWALSSCSGRRYEVVLGWHNWGCQPGTTLLRNGAQNAIA